MTFQRKVGFFPYQAVDLISRADARLNFDRNFRIWPG